MLSKYDGKGGLPKYDVDAVEKYIADNKFYLDDIEKNYELAYKMMNEDKILTAQRKLALEEEKKLKVGDAGTGRAEEADSSLKEQPKRPKTYDDIVKTVLEESKREGKAIITDD
jgi:hypothetical protein